MIECMNSTDCRKHVSKCNKSCIIYNRTCIDCDYYLDNDSEHCNDNVFDLSMPCEKYIANKKLMLLQ